jgi:hypothetical protein
MRKEHRKELVPSSGVQEGDDFSMNVGDRLVYFKHLDDLHKSGMAFEVGIIHPEARTADLPASQSEPTAGILRIPETREFHRFSKGDVGQERAHLQFEVWVRVLTEQLIRANAPIPGKVVDNDVVASLLARIAKLEASVKEK